MRKFGIKLWSLDFIRNADFVKSVEIALKEKNWFGYVELFALPDSFDIVKDKVLRLKGFETIIHAPHARQNFNTSDASEFKANQQRLADAQYFADLLDASTIIVHPGFNMAPASLDENIKQFKCFNEKRIAVENLPYVCSSTHRHLVGVTPDEIKRFLVEVKCQFCLDFSHAICGANYLKTDIYKTLQEFVDLRPCMYHLCDGDIASTVDAHLHYGEGNYDLRRLVGYTEENALITMETGHGIPSSVGPWLNDLTYLRALIE
ncbi:MAG: TIM barrel protein [Alphaproteobacteria bacterium]|nr:TIM barrel protein [Alphaproteobacteria bacterium]